MINTRTALLNKRNATDPSLGLWQSEFGILGDICGQYNGYPKNTSIDYGLYVAKIIHHDLTFANMSSWSWWMSISPYDYSDALIYITDPTGSINLNNSKNDGIVSDSKQLWCMGNFSRFVRPGMKRVSASINGIDDATAASSFMVSTYKDAVARKIVVVVINTGIRVKNDTERRSTTMTTRMKNLNEINSINLPIRDLEPSLIYIEADQSSFDIN